MKRYVLWCSLMWAVSGVVAADEIKVGFGKVDVTPQKALRLSGYGNRTTVSEGVEQKLYARAMVIAVGDQRFVLANADTIGFPASVTAKIAQQLAEKLKVPRERFVLCSTHSHTAPQLSGGIWNIFSEPMTEEQTRNMDQYTQALADGVVQAAQLGVQNLKPAQLTWGETAAAFAVNRRVLKDGAWTGFGVTPEGAVDQAVPIIKAVDAEGKMLGVVFNYACHNTTLGPKFNRVCGDWSGYAAAKLEAAHPGAVAISTIGCGADANPNPRDGLEFAQQHGAALSQVVDKLLAEKLQPLTTIPRAMYAEVDLPFDLPARTLLEQRRTSRRVQEQRHAEYFLSLPELPTHYPCPVQVWRFPKGPTMIFLGGEVVVDYALRLKRDLAPQPLGVSGYSNDVFAYVASERVRREGGYETDFSMIYYRLPGPWAAGTEELLIKRIKEMVGKVNEN